MFRRDKDRERTPQELVQRAILSTIARLGACAYLIYIMIKLIRETDRKPVTLVIAVVFLVLAAVVIVLTVVEFIKGLKNGIYKESTYYTEEYLEKVRQEQEEYRREHPEEFEDETAETDEAAGDPTDEDAGYDEEPPALPEDGEETEEGDE